MVERNHRLSVGAPLQAKQAFPSPRSREQLVFVALSVRSLCEVNWTTQPHANAARIKAAFAGPAIRYHPQRPFGP